MANEYIPQPPRTPRAQQPRPAAGGVYGTAGGGLAEQGRAATWAANREVARIGGAGERRTAEVLDRFARAGGVAVLHDLMLPTANITANIDHVVVSGPTIHLIDTKVWKPGRYWTLGGVTRRGWTRFDKAEKRTMVLAARDIAAYLATQGIDYAHIATPLVVAWPSSTIAPLNLRWLKVPGAKAVTGSRFAAYAEREFAHGRIFGGAEPADPHIVAALARLLVGAESRRAWGA